MAYVTCLMHADTLSIHRDGVEIGTVRERPDGEPVIEIMVKKDQHWVELSFRDMDIIVENWIAMKEIDAR